MLLLELNSLRNVNALRGDQQLTFGPQLTVVYGDNGSGKSGYARVLKKAYRARVTEDILGNVRAENRQSVPAQAVFVVEEPDGSIQSVEWKDGTPISAVGKFAVLDSACARSYLHGGGLGEGPAGLDVVPNFVKDLDRVKHSIADAVRAASPKKDSLQNLENDTVTGRFVRDLSPETTLSSLAEIAQWNSDDSREIETLDKSIAKARLHTRSLRREQLQAQMNALESLAKRIAKWETTVGQSQHEAMLSATSALAMADAALRAVETIGDHCCPVNFAEK